MATVILKNNTVSEIIVNDLDGLRIPASSQVVASDIFQNYKIYESSDLLTHINSGDIIVNNGTSDLSIANALIFLTPYNFVASSGYSGYSGYSGLSGYSGYSGLSGYSGYSGLSGYSGYSGLSGYSGYSGLSGYSGYSGYSGSGSSITSTQLTATADTSTTSTSYVTMSGMTTTVSATATYLITFNASGNGSATGADMTYALFTGTTPSIVQHTERNSNFGGGAATGNYDVDICTQLVSSLTSGDTVEVRYLTSAGTFTVHERSLIIIRIS